MIKMRKLGWFTALVALALAGCGGGGDGSDFAGGSSSGGGGSSGGGAAPATLTVVSSAQSIPSDGSSDATITAYVRDANNALLRDVSVTFSATSGGVAPSTATTNASGAATTTLSTAGDSSLRTITVTATVSGLAPATVAVQVAAATGGNTVQLGTGTGAAFQAGVIGISNANLSAGGSTTLSVSLVQSDGTLYTQDADIIFSSNCVASGTAQIQPSATASTSTGIATVNYVAQGCSGADVITATTTTGGGLSASGTVNVAAAAVGSIIFVSATPTNIALEGTGDASRPESSTVVFRVVDSTGGPVSGAAVSFALNTQVGGISLTPATATSGANGQVQTVVSAGTVATSVKVTATVTSVTPNISTQSSQLTVTTGIPTDASFSLAVGCFNIEGWNVDGVTTDVTARLGDRFQNPVPDGTAVTFTAEGGNILSQCT
ncbi:MAG: Ig-like domain-containing protein, partial [Chloroflexi bacterium]|nr:Ig-like domain-containing protein [Chloroflexota bacterium]